jgi:hypothetical protein
VATDYGVSASLKAINRLHAIERFSKHGIVGKVIRLLLWGYFDEAGHFRGSDDYLCMAGYFGGEQGWNSFTRQWGGLLKKHGISAVRVQDMIGFRGEYEKLGWTHEYRDKTVLPEFIKVIKDNLAAGLGVGVDLKYFKSMAPEAQKRIGDPYYLCFMRLIRLVIDTMRRAGVEFPIAVIFDDAEEYSIKCYRLLSRLRKENAEVKALIGSITFADDSIYYPLQAADLLAYESLKELKQKAGGYKSREHFNDLITTDGGLVYDSHFYDGEYLEKVNAAILSRESGVS